MSEPEAKPKPEPKAPAKHNALLDELARMMVENLKANSAPVAADALDAARLKREKAVKPMGTAGKRPKLNRDGSLR